MKTALLLNEKHKCLTPGAIYKTKIKKEQIEVSVDMSDSNTDEIGADEAKVLEDDLHYAIEKVLAKHFYKK
jgi:hypothetical protein